MSNLFYDIRFAFRMLGRNAGITALAIMTLALGMGGNTVIFSFFNTFYVRPLPYAQPDRLLDLNETAPRWNLEYTGLKYADFDSWRRENRSFESMAAWTNQTFNMSFQDNAERIKGARVTADLPAVLGIQPSLGRFFNADEDLPGAARVVVLGFDVWQRLFGGNRDVLGQALQLNHTSYTIIGVLPRENDFWADSECWVPVAETPDPNSGSYYLWGVGRLKKGITPAAAREDLLRVHRSLIENKLANADTLPRLTPVKERLFGDSKLVIIALMGALALVLLIACGNVAALMLARGLARSRELSIRISLGAPPWSIYRLIVTESLVFSIIAGLLGMLLGRWGQDALIMSLGDNVPHWIHFTFDGRLWLDGFVMVLISALFGALPVIMIVVKGNLSGSLQSSARQSTTGHVKHRSLNTLIVAKMALTLVLLLQAGLLLQAYRAIQKADPGFRADQVLIYQLDLLGSQYGSREAKLAFFKNHLEQVRALPGVTAASAISLPPLGGHTGNFFMIENAPPQGPNQQDPVVLTRSAAPGYFETMGIPLLAGRAFTEQDGMNEGSLAVVVDESFAKRSWPNQDPLGKRIRNRGDKTPWITVVGVAHDVRHYGLDQPSIPGVYLPYVQEVSGGMSVVARTSGDPLSLVSAVRDLVRRGDPSLPVFNVATMSERVHKSLWLRRTYSCLFAIFAAVALLMAVGGIYGVFSYVVGRRTQEIGIRLALGAQPRGILWLVIRQGLVLAGTGIGIGLVVAVATVPLMRKMLQAVSVSDLWACVFVPFLMLAVALLACWVPARRAAKVDPMVALRTE